MNEKRQFGSRKQRRPLVFRDRISSNRFHRYVLILAAVLSVGACGGGGGGGGDSPPAENPSFVPNSGTNSVNTTGGLGGDQDGTGGDGGFLSLYKRGGSGAVEILGQATLDASFSLGSVTPDLGANPLIIDATTTVLVTGVEPATGEPYLVADDSNLYVSDGDTVLVDVDSVMTGLRVEAGVTVTFELNYAAVSQTEIHFTDDVDNLGVITTVEADPAQQGALTLWVASYYGSGQITTAGLQPGQAGGAVELTVDVDIFNEGAIDASGADDSTGMGGDGGTISLLAGNTLYNAGDLSSRGGAGTTGGAGGTQTLAVDVVGELRNSGHLDTSGGAATAGAGGAGGPIDIYVYGGKITSTGNLTSVGGHTVDLSAAGGNGGVVFVRNTYADNLTAADYTDDTPPGDILITGDINTAGGDAATNGSGGGGLGGYVDIFLDAYSHPRDQRLALLNYLEVLSDGGGGNHGGNGGGVDMLSEFAFDAVSMTFQPAGVVNNVAHLYARGGSVVASSGVLPAIGGNGAGATLATDDLDDLATRTLTSNGDIDTRGGDSLEDPGLPSGFPSGGQGGFIDMFGVKGLSNSGAINASGGRDIGTDGGVTGFGGDAARDVLLGAAAGTLTNRGAITANGGDGEYAGGFADVLLVLRGPTVVNSGALQLNGGNADPGLAGSTGGIGGLIEYRVSTGSSPTRNGAESYAGGAGQTPGSDGFMFITYEDF